MRGIAGRQLSCALSHVMSTKEIWCVNEVRKAGAETQVGADIGDSAQAILAGLV